MNFWSRFITWLNGLFGGSANNPDRYKKKVYKELELQQQKIHQYKNALAGLVARQQKMIVRIRGWSEEVEKLENLKHAAAISTRKRVVEMKAAGQAAEAIRGDANYTENLLSFERMNTQRAALLEQIEGQESQVRELSGSINEHKRIIRDLIDQQRSVQSDLDETLFELRTAQREKELFDAMAINTAEAVEPTALKELREMRIQARAEARVARDSIVLQSALEGFAPDETPDIDFDAMVGLEEG